MGEVGTEPGGSRRGRRLRRALVGLLVVVALLLLVAIGFYWWFVMRDRGPVVEGEIDETLLTEPTQLCVRGGRRPCRSVDSVEQVLSAPILTIE